ncbi:MAG: hypothetical protein ABG776_01745 [Cyanobacteria bacterium J06555_13]
MKRLMKELMKRLMKRPLPLKRALGILGLFSLSFALVTVPLSRGKNCSNYPKTSANAEVSADPNQLSVLLYNTQLRPRMLFVSGQSDRTQKMIPLLAGYDVVVLSEVFDDQALRELKALHTYNSVSLALGQNQGLSQDSGLVIFSQWPIVTEAQQRMLFEGECEGRSCFNHQGVLAIALKKSDEGPTYHIITAQMQAGDSQRAVAIRAKQYQQVKQFIADINIPPSEPAIFAASLPISPQTHAAEFAQMQTTLGLKIINVEAAKNDATPFSVNPTQNTLSSTPSPYLPDTLFTLAQDTSVQSASAQVQPMRVSPQQGWKSASWFYWQCPQQNLSDHPAIAGRLQLGNRK